MGTVPAWTWEKYLWSTHWEQCCISQLVADRILEFLDYQFYHSTLLSFARRQALRIIWVPWLGFAWPCPRCVALIGSAGACVMVSRALPKRGDLKALPLLLHNLPPFYHKEHQAFQEHRPHLLTMTGCSFVAESSFCPSELFCLNQFSNN